MANQHGAGGSGSFFRACILLLLAERPSHGYDLLERLAAFGFDSGDSGWLYRTLRAFERDGSVDSTWEISSSGPPRRVYALTPRGSVRLDSATNAVRASKRAIDDYLERTARAGRSSRGRHTGPRDPGNPGGAGG